MTLGIHIQSFISLSSSNEIFFALFQVFYLHSEVYSEPSQTSKMELFTHSFFLDVSLRSESPGIKIANNQNNWYFSGRVLVFIINKRILFSPFTPFTSVFWETFNKVLKYLNFALCSMSLTNFANLQDRHAQNVCKQTTCLQKGKIKRPEVKIWTFIIIIKVVEKSHQKQLSCCYPNGLIFLGLNRQLTPKLIDR